jgi:hypothetical protein
MVFWKLLDFDKPLLEGSNPCNHCRENIKSHKIFEYLHMRSNCGIPLRPMFKFLKALTYDQTVICLWRVACVSSEQSSMFCAAIKIPCYDSSGSSVSSLILSSTAHDYLKAPLRIKPPTDLHNHQTRNIWRINQSPSTFSISVIVFVVSRYHRALNYQ